MRNYRKIILYTLLALTLLPVLGIFTLNHIITEPQERHKLVSEKRSVKEIKPLTKAEIQQQLQKTAEYVKNPILKRLILEDPKELALEQAEIGDTTPFATIEGYAATKITVGIKCPENQFLYTYLIGCMAIPIDGPIKKRIETYNRTLITSPHYTGSCKLSPKHHSTKKR